MDDRRVISFRPSWTERLRLRMATRAIRSGVAPLRRARYGVACLYLVSTSVVARLISQLRTEIDQVWLRQPPQLRGPMLGALFPASRSFR